MRYKYIWRFHVKITDYALYALNSMEVKEGAYNVTNPLTRTTPINSGSYTRDGWDISSGIFFTQSFWNTTLGFTSADWNFSRVGKNGYPQLKWE